MKKWLAKTKNARRKIRDFLEEKGLESAHHAQLSGFHKFAHFWLLVTKNFSRNRCPVHASALAYTSLLALVPMLAVGLSISTAVMKNQGQEQMSVAVDRFVENFLGSAPVKVAPVENVNPDSAPTDATLAAKSADERSEVVTALNGFIKNTRSGTLGVTGGIVLIFIVISMLARIEASFNDIWDVTKGRTWLARVVQYSAVIFWVPVLLMLAIGLIGGPHFQSSRKLVESMPLVGSLLFHVMPVVVLCLGFALFYMLMPYTKVKWQAAAIGGVVGGLLWHFNNIISALYISRWVTNSKIYGSMAAIPVFMAGLYFSWLFLLFGAQVAQAFQNRAAYLEEKQADHVNQRGREFIALRLMECIGQRFHCAMPPAILTEIAHVLAVPTRLIQQVIEPLLTARIVVEVVGEETAFAPGRPLEAISCHDILLALRAGQGQELPTRDGPARTGVYGEFERILEAEEKAASAITVLTMVNRTEKLAAASGHRVKAVTDGKTD